MPPLPDDVTELAKLAPLKSREHVVFSDVPVWVTRKKLGLPDAPKLFDVVRPKDAANVEFAVGLNTTNTEKFWVGRYHVVLYPSPYVPLSLPAFGKFTPEPVLARVPYTDDVVGVSVREDALSVQLRTFVPDKEKDVASVESSQRTNPETAGGVT
jgi:hypothetical protein